MTFRALIQRSLRFHWRAHLGVVLGAAIGSAALIGALVVGDSVRESLRQQALRRLGKIQFALQAGDRTFTDQLAARMPSDLKDSWREDVQYVIDLRRAVDLLLARPDVDPQRLAYEGHSGGGAIGGLLAGIEDRLKGYVLVVGDGGLVTHLTGPEDFMWWDYKPKGLREKWIAWMWPIEPVHYVGCAAPAALLFQNGTLDNSVPPQDAMRYQQAGSEPKTILWYEGGH